MANTVGNNLLTNTRHNALLENSDVMEANNLSQSAARETATLISTSGETAAAVQTFLGGNLELKLPILSSSSSDSETEVTANPTAAAAAGNDGDRAASPPPNCAICLGRCKNKCFTDSCMHQFCFKCLCEWSKVKPECPLCKQTFKSIIHNVKSIDQFEEYHVQPPTVPIRHPSLEFDLQEMRIFGVLHRGNHRNSSAWNEATHRPFFYGDFSATSPNYLPAIPSASGSSGNRSTNRQYLYHELLDLYRQEYPEALANSNTLSQLWRRYVYDRKLYAMPVADITGRFRESSARFYRENPAQVHRLMPWINRDIVCLLREIPQRIVTNILESINSALTVMNILSPLFRRRLQPFLGTKTAHFIHELNNFARSPYDIIGYDRAVQYLPQTSNEEIVIEFTSSDDSTDNEQIDVAGDGGNSSNTASTTSRSRSANTSSANAINLTIHNRLSSVLQDIRGAFNGNRPEVDDISLVIDLRGESDNNEATTTAQTSTNSVNYESNNQTIGASDDDVIARAVPPTVSENIELTSGSSDECEFVLERKPPHLRTPEMVSLDSASDSDVVFVDESKPLNKTSFSSSEGEFNENPSDHKRHGRQQNKIAALVDAKKRNQSANLVKSEQQESHAEVYNLGASTSAALRLSLQNRVDKSHRPDGATSSKRARRYKYSLRNNDRDRQTRANRQASRRRGENRRLDRESSHSSTSSSTTISSSSCTTTSTNSSSSSSDEEYFASTSQRKKPSFAGEKNKKTKKRRNNNSNSSHSNNKKAFKRDAMKRNQDYSSDEDGGDNDRDYENGRIGKKFDLIMSRNENRKKRKLNRRHEESDEENSWRLKAVNEPLRKQQLQQAKSSSKSSERKRKHKSPTHGKQESTTDGGDSGKKQKFESQKRQQEKEIQKAINYLNSEDTTSDESDNINLIQLKTKLTGGHDAQKELRNEPATNTDQAREMTSNLDVGTSEQNGNRNTATVSQKTSSAPFKENSIIPTSATATNGEETGSINTPITNCPYDQLTTQSTTNETVENLAESVTTQNASFNSSDDSNGDNMHNNNKQGHLCSNSNNPQSINSSYPNDGQSVSVSASSQNYAVDENNDNNNTQLYHNEENVSQDADASVGNGRHNVGDDGDHDHNDDDSYDDDDNDDEEEEEEEEEEGDETFSNNPLTINLNESNVFADGTSMSTTTTDTILHEAAEQISSSAVNFYNPQQTFNTADFADENSTNSSSSDSSISSSTTTVSSSINSSSTNSNSYINYDQS